VQPRNKCLAVDKLVIDILTLAFGNQGGF
jgi:hypothetical protein